MKRLLLLGMLCVAGSGYCAKVPAKVQDTALLQLSEKKKKAMTVLMLARTNAVNNKIYTFSGKPNIQDSCIKYDFAMGEHVMQRPIYAIKKKCHKIGSVKIYFEQPYFTGQYKIADQENVPPVSNQSAATAAYAASAPSPQQTLALLTSLTDLASKSAKPTKTQEAPF